jgi:hypothetical protein
MHLRGIMSAMRHQPRKRRGRHEAVSNYNRTDQNNRNNGGLYKIHDALSGLEKNRLAPA